MAKIKLKNVQSGVDGEGMNLMNAGQYFYDESGNIIDESGNIIDPSGHVVIPGYLEISGGNTNINVGTFPYFRVEVEWESGEVTLPLSEHPNYGIEPCVPVNFNLDKNYIGYTPGYEIISTNNDLIVNWVSPLYAQLSYNYVLKMKNGMGQLNGTAYGDFSIPYTYHPPVITED